MTRSSELSGTHLSVISHPLCLPWVAFAFHFLPVIIENTVFTFVQWNWNSFSSFKTQCKVLSGFVASKIIPWQKFLSLSLFLSRSLSLSLIKYINQARARINFRVSGSNLLDGIIWKRTKNNPTTYESGWCSTLTSFEFVQGLAFFSKYVHILRHSVGFGLHDLNPFLGLGEGRLASGKCVLEKMKSDGKRGCGRWEKGREGRRSKGSPNNQEASQLRQRLAGSSVHLHRADRGCRRPCFQKWLREEILSILNVFKYLYVFWNISRNIPGLLG